MRQTARETSRYIDIRNETERQPVRRQADRQKNDGIQIFRQKDRDSEDVSVDADLQSMNDIRLSYGIQLRAVECHRRVIISTSTDIRQMTNT